jgi:hypothetical protein
MPIYGSVDDLAVHSMCCARDGAHQTLSLAQWLLEDHAKHQANFNRQIRIDRLTARRRSRRCRPQSKDVIADPDSQITASPQAFV